MALHTNVVFIEGDLRDDADKLLATLGFERVEAGRVVDYTEAMNLGPEGAAVAWLKMGTRPGFTVLVDASLLFAAVGPSPWGERSNSLIEVMLRRRSRDEKRCLHMVVEGFSATYGFSAYHDGRQERAWLLSESDVVCDLGHPVEDTDIADPTARIIDTVERLVVPWERVEQAEFQVFTYEVRGAAAPWSAPAVFDDDDDGWDAVDPSEDDQVEEALRWRLILGQFADDRLGFGRLRDHGNLGRLADGAEGRGEQAGDLSYLLRDAERMDTALEYIYDREFARRAHRTASLGGGGLTVPAWLSGVRDLFPGEAVQVIERDALSRYGMTELVTDPEILANSEPSEDLMKAILQFKHMMTDEVLELARGVVREVVDKMAVQIKTDCAPALYGSHEPDGRPPRRTFRNIDWRKTILRNLKNYDLERQRLIADRFFYKHRQKKRSNWRIIISVDQSGSMMDSLIHSSIMSAIFCTLPSVEVHLVLWDTRVVDASDLAHDPLEVLMGCQLGGGTDLAPAMNYCANLITEPEKTIFVLISDWYIWGDAQHCLNMAHQLNEAGVTGIGLCALDADCRPIYDERFAQELADTGWFVAALTPKQLAEHVARIIH